MPLRKASQPRMPLQYVLWLQVWIQPRLKLVFTPEHGLQLLDHQTWQEHPANSLQGHCWLTSKHYIYHFTFTATLETSLGHREFPFHPTDTSKHEGNALRSLWGLPRLLVLLVVVSGRRDSARLFPPIWADDGEASRWQSWQSKGWITWMNQSVPQS